MKLRWSKRALKDVAQLRDYIALDSPFYARQFIGRLALRLESLPEFPQSGRVSQRPNATMFAKLFTKDIAPFTSSEKYNKKL